MLSVGLTISVYAGTTPERAGRLEIHDGYRIAQPLTTLYVDIEDLACDDQGPGTMQIPFCTIQVGYDAAADGDELRVMPGTYAECLLLYDLDAQKGIRVVADAWSSGGDNTSTIIDASTVPDCTHSYSGQSAAVVNLGGFGGKFEGFTVRGGTASGIFGVGPVVITHNVVRDNDSIFGGGGVYVYSATCYYGDATTEVSFNEITNNSATGDGGGISITAGQLGVTCGATGDALVIVEGNNIHDNTADGNGGGILASTFTAFDNLSAEVVITSNTISGNSASSQSFLGQGGGIFGYTYGYGTESIKALDNIIANNTTLDYGGGASMWIDPESNHTSIDHQIVFEGNTVTANDAGYGGGGLDLVLRTADLRVNQRAEMRVSGNVITENVLTADVPDQTYGGGGVLVYIDSRNSNSPRIDVLLEANHISHNSAFGFGGGVSLFVSAISDQGNDPSVDPPSAHSELRNNVITLNDANTNQAGFQSAGGGVFTLLEAEGDALARVEMTLNTIAFNTLDNMALAGGVHAESFTVPDVQGRGGRAELAFENSIVASNVGVGLGGPVPGLPGLVTPGGLGDFSVTASYNDFFGNTAGGTDGWIVLGPGNISEDPLFVAPPTVVQLGSASPAIDAGDPLFVPDDGQTDINGDPRVLDGNDDGVEVVDMGVDEYVRRTITIEIDIKPDSVINHINPKNRGVIPVALLGSDGFDITTLDPTSLRFGSSRAETAHDLSRPGTYHGHLQDVNYDGFMDLVTHYRTQAVGLGCSDQTSLMVLTGQTFDGQEVEGSDWVVTVGCPGSRRPGGLVNWDDAGSSESDGVKSIEHR